MNNRDSHFLIGQLSDSLQKQYKNEMRYFLFYVSSHFTSLLVSPDLWDYKRNRIFSDSDRVMFDFVIAASQVPNGVTDKIANKVREFFNEGEIVEILGVVALFGYLNRWNDSMGTELENPAKNSADKILSRNVWNIGKHQY